MLTSCGRLLVVCCCCSADQTRWYRDANGNFFIPIPTKREAQVEEADPLARWVITKTQESFYMELGDCKDGNGPSVKEQPTTALCKSSCPLSRQDCSCGLNMQHLN